MNREEFRLARTKKMSDVSDALLPWIEDDVTDEEAILLAVHEQFLDLYRDTEFALSPKDAWDWFRKKVEPGLEAARATSDPRKIADWLGTAVVNGVHALRRPERRKMWLSRRDPKVRPFHVEADGQVVKVDEPFVVCGGVEMDFPGEPVGDPSCWINCRCVLASPSQLTFEETTMPITEDDVAAFMSEPTGWDDGMDDDLDDDLPEDDAWLEDDEDDDPTDPDRLMWHALLVPEGVESGDGRKFSKGALTWRDLPLPMRWQREDQQGHDGAVTVAVINRIERFGDDLWGEGSFLDEDDADRAVGQIMDGGLRGVSIDADQAEMAADPEDGTVEFAKGRISAATLVAIPAFMEATIRLGPMPEDPTAEKEATYEEFLEPEFAVSEKPWDGSASRFTPEEYKRSTILHKCDGLEKSCHSLPIREPGGQLSRAGVHAAAARLNQVDATPAQKAAARRALRAAYRELGEEVPDSLAASAFARGPGWVTHPKETRKLHHYWTKGAGARKVRWGTPGDFRRLRRHLAKYIEPRFLNRVVAQWHHDALGYWPGQCGRPGNPPCGKRRRGHSAESVSLAAAAPVVWDSAMFEDPGLTEPTALVVDGDHVYGHIAAWGTCHVGIRGVCTTAPRSQTGYAIFRTGAVMTDKGRISVGQITMNTGHADLDLEAYGTKAHYDHTGTVVADVAAGEDEHGIWVSGAVRDGATAEQRHALQAGALSGDWRTVGGALELVAALVVNVPGFPVPRPALAADAGEQVSLIAAGVVDAPMVERSPIGMTVGDIAGHVIAELDGRERRRKHLAALSATMVEARLDLVAATIGGR